MQEGFQHSLSLYLCFCFPSSATQRVPAASPSAHSISTATPDRTRFPRGSSSRSTFHGEQLRERRNATYNGPPASPSHETGAFAHARRGTSTGIISKITSKFVRRLVPRFLRERKEKPSLYRAISAKSLKMSSLSLKQMYIQSECCLVCVFLSEPALFYFSVCIVTIMFDQLFCCFICKEQKNASQKHFCSCFTAKIQRCYN